MKKTMSVICSALMALTIFPAEPIIAHAAEIPVKSYASRIDTSKFPHATGSPMDKQTFWNVCGNLTGKITFSRAAYPGGGTPLNGDSTVYAVISGPNATIYSRNGGGVFAPVDSYSLFRESDASGQFVRATEYDFYGLDTSRTTDMGLIFYCSRASYLDLSSFDTSNVTNMHSFVRDSNISSLNISNLNTANVTNMYYMFAGLRKTQNLDVSSFNTSKVTNMSGMFGWSGAKNLNLSNFDTSNVTDMRYMFSGSGAANVNVSSFDTRRVTDMGYMFSSCLANNLDLSSFDTSGATDIGYMFYDARATSVLCRNEWEVNRMRSSSNCSANGFHIRHETYHTMGAPSYSWAGNNSYCVATRNCTAGSCIYSEQTTSTSVQNIVSRQPTCVTPGDTKYIAYFNSPWASQQEKILYNNIPAIGHSMGAASYVWSPDGKSCTAVRKCIHEGCNYTESFNGTISSSIVKQPTCTEKGQTKYDATFAANWAATQSKTIADINAAGHKWQEVWSKDDSKHWHECSVCHIHKDESVHIWNAGEVKESPSCDKAGSKVYTCSICGKTKAEEIPAIGHDWNVKYSWNEDHTACKAVHVCRNDSAHNKEISSVEVRSSVVKAPTCTTSGDTEYTAIFDVSWAESQTERVNGNIPQIAHSWKTEWDKDENNHWHECSVCHIHKDENIHTWDNGIITTPATCTKQGVKTYTCTECKKTKTEFVPAINHELGEVTYMWAPNGKACAAIRKCIHAGCEYKETDAGIISNEVSKEATCGTRGDTKYTATFTQPWAKEQTKIVVGDIPSTGKHVYDDEFDAECNVCGQTRAQKTNTIPINEITFPDDNFRNWVLNNIDGKDGVPVVMIFRSAPVDTKDGQLDNKEQQATGSIDVHAQGIKDLRGIEYFPNLRVLDCSDNQLEDLNLSNNEKLESVDASNNPGLNKVEVNNKLDGILVPTVDENVKVDFVEPHNSKKSGEGNNIPVVLTTAAHTFSVTIPTSLPISVAADGVISCADASACKVINNEEGPVDIKSVTLSGDNQWIIVPTSTEMESEAVNTKKLAMTVMGYDTNDGGLDTTSFVEQTINGNADFGIIYTAKLPTQTVETDKVPVANVVFTIGWHEAV